MDNEDLRPAFNKCMAIQKKLIQIDVDREELDEKEDEIRRALERAIEPLDKALACVCVDGFYGKIIRDTPENAKIIDDVVEETGHVNVEVASIRNSDDFCEALKYGGYIEKIVPVSEAVESIRLSHSAEKREARLKRTKK